MHSTCDRMNPLLQVKPTPGDSYQLDVWMEFPEGKVKRGSFLFVMPDVTTRLEVLPLLDRAAMEEEAEVVLYTPGISSGEFCLGWSSPSVMRCTQMGIVQAQNEPN